MPTAISLLDKLSSWFFKMCDATQKMDKKNSAFVFCKGLTLGCKLSCRSIKRCFRRVKQFNYFRDLKFKKVRAKSGRFP